jgi:hypothetical protein
LLGSTQAPAEIFYYCLKSSSRKISRLDLAQLKKLRLEKLDISESKNIF